MKEIPSVRSIEVWDTKVLNEWGDETLSNDIAIDITVDDIRNLGIAENNGNDPLYYDCYTLTEELYNILQQRFDLPVYDSTCDYILACTQA